MCKRVLAGWRGLLGVALTAALTMALFADAAAASRKPTSVVGSESGSLAPKRPGDAADQEGLVRKPTLFARTGYVWPFATGPIYGERQVAPERWRKPGMLHTSVGHFDLTLGAPDFPPELTGALRLDLGAQYFLLQVHPDTFRDGSFDQLRSWIEDQGGKLIEPLPVGAFVVRLSPAAFGGLQGQPGVLALMPYHPAFKLSPEIGRLPLPDPARAVSEVYRLRVELFPDEDAQMVAQAIADLGGNVVKIWPGTVTVELHRDKLAQLAALEPVRFVFEDVPILPTGEETTTTMQTGRYNAGAIPYHDAGVTGGGAGIAPSGQIMMEVDSGIQLDAGDLSNTRTSAGTPGSSHRKVIFYGTTSPFGGAGDDQGCDATTSGGFTHGHTVAATALGWATNVTASYGQGFVALDEDGNPWKLDGVAPLAKLVAYDAQATPSTLSCSDPAAGGLNVGDLYTPPSGGSMADAYAKGARTFNFSFGGGTGTYGQASDVDAFMFDHKDALVFVSAGNLGSDTDNNGVPDPGTITDPATCKNCVSVGASGDANDTGVGGGPNDRAFFSSVGPATSASNRKAPLLMAPGTDFGNIGNMGLDSEFSCRTNDNDQNDPVECDIVQGVSGTSFSSPAAAGAAMLVRDYFAQGFYPDGTSSNTNNTGDLQATVSGALVKAVLVASAEFMTGGNLTEGFRFNNEQGYGRIQLDNVLPLSTWAASPTGLIVADGGIAGGPNNTSLSGTATPGGTETFTFQVNDNTQELRVACAWVEAAGDVMVNDIHIELCESNSSGTCTGKKYIGNFFSEDANANDNLDAGENCINGFDPENPTTNAIEEGAWSIPTNNCGTAPAPDTANPTEAIMISPDPKGDGVLDNPQTPGINEGDDNQITPGFYTLTVKGDSANTGNQTYACALAGPVALGSSVRFNKGVFVCNDLAEITVSETDEASDPKSGLTPTEVSSRVKVQVLDANNNVVDEETGLTFSQPDPNALRFVVEDIALTVGTARSSSATFNNGVFDVRPGEKLKVIYRDETSGSPDPNKERFNTAAIDCDVRVGFGGIVWGQFGMDTAILVDGGCERDARGKFTFGFPDRYMDAGEVIGYRLAFQSTEPTETLRDVEVTLTCVQADADSPADCKPGTQDCPDPERLNNPDCSGLLTILDPVKTIGVLPPTAAISVNYTVQMASSISGTPDIEMVARIRATKAGKSGSAAVVSRHTLDVDEKMLFYSTDFPSGGVEIWDWNNDEQASPTTCGLDVPCTEAQRGTPTTNIGEFLKDYRFETIQWSTLTAGGKNAGIAAPWNLNGNNGAFRVGLHTSTDISLANERTIANWGEDRNFNNVLDAGEDRDPVNGVLNANWGTGGGCGWQTAQGVWHTGTIGNSGATPCTFTLGGTGACQLYETSGAATTNQRFWMELLKTPVVEQVNDTFRPEILGFDWNASVNLKDQWAFLTYELDTNTTALLPSNLDAFPVLNLLNGPHGAEAGGNDPLTDGFLMFASTHVCSGDTTVVCSRNKDCEELSLGTCQPSAGGVSVNGTQGNNRSGKNSCFFEGAGVSDLPFALAKPRDDDRDNDTDGVIDEYVQANGPIRNYNLTHVNGPDMRFTTLEDIYGPSGPSFQAAFGFLTIEGTPFLSVPQQSFGVAIDDVVLYWKEVTTGKDQTDCTPSAGPSGGACASVEIQQTNVFEGQTRLTVRIVDRFPYNLHDADPANNNNDCDCDGTFGEAGEDQDCNNNGTSDITAILTSESLDLECLALDLVDPLDPLDPTKGGVYEGSIPVSSSYDAAGVLFLRGSGTDNPTVTVRYPDIDDGTGSECPNDANPDVAGTVVANSTVFLNRATLIIAGSRIVDNGDNDAWADTGETVQLFLTIANKSGVDLENVVLRLATDDPDIECIHQPFVDLGTLLEGATVEIPTPFRFKVSNATNRTDVNQDLTATFTLTMSALGFDALLRAQELTLDLDLDATGTDPGHTNQIFTFENNGLSQAGFTTNDIDSGKNSLALSDGFRCQYNDPDNPNSNSYNRQECFLGFTNPANNGFDWHIAGTSGGSTDPGGRAKGGTRSAHWGMHPSNNAADNTTRLKQLEAIHTTASWLLGWTNANPKLQVWHQVSLMDFRASNTPFGEAVDRAVVHVKVDGSTTWQKVFPFENVYDVQGTDAFTNCMFDPIDDGNDEDDFFDPTDPLARLGPSSTCFPEFVFGFQGDTRFDTPFSPLNTGRASDPENASAGSAGNGTWVRTSFDLSRFRARKIQVRFLTTSIEISNSVSYLAAGFPAGLEADDGWYIDDVTIVDVASNQSANPGLTADSGAAPPDQANCANKCNTVTAALTADPSSLAAPGQVTELDASGSTADRCVDGTLQYRFWADDGDGVPGTAGDTLLRDWTDNPFFVDAPLQTTKYLAEVRCSTAASCVDSSPVLTVNVTCPSNGTVPAPDFTQTVLAQSNKQTFNWTSAATVDVVKGDLNALRSTKSFTGTDTCLADDQTISSFSDAATPASGAGFYYLVRNSSGELCNEGPGTWGSSKRDSELTACP